MTFQMGAFVSEIDPIFLEDFGATWKPTCSAGGDVLMAVPSDQV